MVNFMVGVVIGANISLMVIVLLLVAKFDDCEK